MTRCIGIDVGGSAIKHALIDSQGHVHDSQEIPTPETMPDFIKTIKTIQNLYRLTETAGIAISMPGLIDSTTGMAIHGGALLFVQQLNLRDILQEACGVPVQIENDGKCAALGEHWHGNLVGIKNGIALVIGTGIGGGIIINNQLLRGHHLTAGEFSYIRTNGESDDFQSLFAIQGSAQMLSHTYASMKGVEPTEMNGKKFFEDVNNQLPDAVKLLDSYTEKLARQIMNLQTILDPEVITIGGGISRQTALFNGINQHIERMIDAFPLPLMRPTVIQSSLGNHANLLGALKNFVDKEAK